MPVIIHTDKCDGCHGSSNPPCVRMCPGDLLMKDPQDRQNTDEEPFRLLGLPTLCQGMSTGGDRVQALLSARIPDSKTAAAHT